MDWKSADTQDTKKICGYLEEYQPDATSTLLEIPNSHLLEKEFISIDKLHIENVKKKNNKLF